ncbi:MAG: hypothetical protein KAT68_05155 [Bacteroidales bacterium]|nr:hypothetical protein [Bacteroidales bacterium]
MRQFLMFLLIIPGLLLANVVKAQLSDRINSPTTFKVGTRPIAGNMAISIGTSYRDIEDFFDEDKDFEALPIVTFKYYNSDDLVITFGIKEKNEKVVRTGDIDPIVDGGLLTLKEYKKVESEFMIVPGVEKHFLGSNILDVYIGACVPLGLVRDVLIDKENYTDGGKVESTAIKNSFAYGLDGFVGVQAFIADLPLALGLEFKISGMGYRGKKTKHEYSMTAVGTAVNQTYYTADDDPDNLLFKDLKSRTFETSSDIRFSLNYFFGR